MLLLMLAPFMLRLIKQGQLLLRVIWLHLVLTRKVHIPVMAIFVMAARSVILKLIGFWLY